MGKGKKKKGICLALRPPPLRLHHLHRKIKRPFQLLQSLSTLQASSSRVTLQNAFDAQVSEFSPDLTAQQSKSVSPLETPNVVTLQPASDAQIIHLPVNLVAQLNEEDSTQRALTGFVKTSAVIAPGPEERAGKVYRAIEKTKVGDNNVPKAFEVGGTSLSSQQPENVSTAGTITRTSSAACSEVERDSSDTASSELEAEEGQIM
ncbi:hypothetical protein HID58_047036, partial [Brassica napus]